MKTELNLSMTLCLMMLSKGTIMHGYTIKGEISKLTAGKYKVSWGTLYRSLAVLEERGLLVEVPGITQPDHDARRKYYQITDDGQKAVSAEFKRLEKLIQVARSLNLIDGKD